MELSANIDYLLKVKAAPLAVTQKCINQLNLNPTYPIILVGGTNGKGSVCAYLTTILSLAGFKVGTFTSPHVLSYNERICLNNKAVDDETLNSALETVINVAKQQNEIDNLGLFQTFTLAAQLIFMQQNVDIAIIEVGIGGKNDVTNLFEPTISAITTVAYDHCDILGNSLEEIGLEKSGVFRTHKWGFYGSNKPPHSLIEYAQQIDTKFQQFSVNFGLVKQELSFDVWCEDKKYFTLPYPGLRGDTQPNNVALALAILSKLQDKFPLSSGAIKTGILQTKLIGRFQLLPGLPQIILDVAHNTQAVTVMLQNMLKLPFAKRNLAVFGIANDKDVAQIIRLCKDSFDQWYIAKINKPNGLSTPHLAEILLQNGVLKQNIIECENISMAYQKASKCLNNEDRLICFGSFLVVEDTHKTIQSTRI